MEWQKYIFNEDDIIGYKQQADALTSYQYDGQQFFHINPMRAHVYGAGGGSKANIATLQNILIEWDGLTLRKQANLAARAGIPYALSTYSGGKSIHFIISMREPFESEQEYNYYARLIMTTLKSDISMANINRVSRVPNATRDNGKKQELLEARDYRITKSELIKWLTQHKYMRNKVAKIKKEWALIDAERKRAVTVDGPKTILPNIYRMMVEGGQLHPMTNSRHESLVKFASWLKANWHEQSEVEELLNKAADSMGISGRGDVEGIIRWIR